MEKLFTSFISIMVVGCSLGSLFGLVGLAYTVIINSCQLVNFGQGDFAMFGVAACWFLAYALGLPLWIAFPAAVVLGGLLGMATERFMVTPLLKKQVHPFYPILGTMAVGTVIAGAVGVYTGFYWMQIKYFFGVEPLRFHGISADSQGALIVLTTLALVIAYWLLLNKTRTGAALRATGFNREVSTLLGIQTSRMVCLSFVISSVIAAIAGILCAPLSAFTALDGLPLAVNGFIALIVGGWGNPYAAVLGGITLGVIRALLTGYFSSTHAELTTFVVLLFVLTIKPSGIYAGFMMPKTAKD